MAALAGERPESMRDGVVTIDGDAGNAVAAAIRAGVVVVRGDASTRAGIAMKGNAPIVGGSVLPHGRIHDAEGVIIVCGDAADGVADSMYAGTVYVAGKTAASLGADAVVEEFTAGDRDLVYSHLERRKISAPAAGFRKLVAGQKLWNFQKADLHLWEVGSLSVSGSHRVGPGPPLSRCSMPRAEP